MSFETLLGNEQLKKNLTAALGRGHISHFYLISGPQGSGKHTLARLLAGAILCQGVSSPCLSCPVCRRVMADQHPDVITVADPEHKNVAVRIVRQFREDVFIRPNESPYKIYIFPQDLGVEGQNALLKILEEPPQYGVFLLLTDNPHKILPTVRSRCTELKLLPLESRLLIPHLQQEFPHASAEDVHAAARRSGGYLGQAREILAQQAEDDPQTQGFLRALSQRDPLLLTQTLVPMEKWKRDALAEKLQSWLVLCENALSARLAGAPVPTHSKTLAANRSSGELMEIIRLIQKAKEYTLSNVSPAAVCGWLSWALR